MNQLVLFVDPRCYWQPGKNLPHLFETLDARWPLWSVRSSPDRAVWVRALAGTLCCVLGQDTNSYSASLHQAVQMGAGEFNSGSNGTKLTYFFFESSARAVTFDRESKKKNVSLQITRYWPWAISWCYQFMKKWYSTFALTCFFRGWLNRRVCTVYVLVRYVVFPTTLSF